METFDVPRFGKCTSRVCFRRLRWLLQRPFSFFFPPFSTLLFRTTSREKKKYFFFVFVVIFRVDSEMVGGIRKWGAENWKISSWVGYESFWIWGKRCEIWVNFVDWGFQDDVISFDVCSDEEFAGGDAWVASQERRGGEAEGLAAGIAVAAAVEGADAAGEEDVA